jgi:hypothetical protein
MGRSGGVSAAVDRPDCNQSGCRRHCSRSIAIRAALPYPWLSSHVDRLARLPGIRQARRRELIAAAVKEIPTVKCEGIMAAIANHVPHLQIT